MSERGSNSSSRSSFLPFPFIWWGRNEGLKIVEMSSHFYQGTTTTHTTLQASQSLFDLVVTEISARNEISIQSLLEIRFRNDVSGYLIYSLRAWVSYELKDQSQISYSDTVPLVTSQAKECKIFSKIKIAVNCERTKILKNDFQI